MIDLSDLEAIRARRAHLRARIDELHEEERVISRSIGSVVGRGEHGATIEDVLEALRQRRRATREQIEDLHAGNRFLDMQERILGS